MDGLLGVIQPMHPEVDFLMLAAPDAEDGAAKQSLAKVQDNMDQVWLQGRTTELEVFTCLTLNRGGDRVKSRLGNYTTQFNKDTKRDWRDWMHPELRAKVHEHLGTSEKPAQEMPAGAAGGGAAPTAPVLALAAA